MGPIRRPARGAGTRFETGLDWSSPDSITQQEAEALEKWYAESHGEGNLDLAPFVPFSIAHAPGMFKLYRRHVQTISEVPNGLPQAAVVLMFLHYYMAVGNDRGTLYEIVACRDAGVSKQQVIDAIEFTFLVAGPFSANTAAVSAWDYLNRWNADEDDPDGVWWPDGWGPVVAEDLEAGLDFATTELSAEDLEALRRWYARHEGETPPHVEFLAEYRPDVLVTLRQRCEHAWTWSLPRQMLPLFRLHRAVIEGCTTTVRQALRQARALGVTRDQFVQAICWASLYVDSGTLDVVTADVMPLLRDWR